MNWYILKQLLVLILHDPKGVFWHLRRDWRESNVLPEWIDPTPELTLVSKMTYLEFKQRGGAILDEIEITPAVLRLLARPGMPMWLAGFILNHEHCTPLVQEKVLRCISTW